MGLLAFLFGGKKKAGRAPAGPTLVEGQLQAIQPVQRVETGAGGGPDAPGAIPTAAGGVVQAKLRLKLSASLRAGQAADAHTAAQALADIQAKAGRPTAARRWREQAERIRDDYAA